jgi:hypothetical protein
MGRGFLVVGFTLALAAAAPADTIHVDWAGGGDYLTIQEGVDGATEGDTVLVAPGTYSGAGNYEISFHGTNLTLASSAGAESTIIDCEGGGTTAIRLNAAEDTTSVIGGFTITGADTCIAALTSSPLIEDCVMLHPARVGVYCEFSAVVIRRTEFLGTAWEGPNDDGVLCWWGDPGPTLSHCVFNECAGGLDTWYCSPIVRHCDFVRCVEGKGCGANIRHGSPLFEDCLFFECRKNTLYGAYGTGLLMDDCDSVVRRVRFERNGVYYTSTNFSALGFTGGTLVLDRVVFWDNPISHAAVIASADECAISRCTFVDNMAHAVSFQYGEIQASIDSTIIAYNNDTIFVGEETEVTTRHSCIFDNTQGDSLPGAHLENLFTDPLFCDYVSGDLTLRDDSPCLPGNNPWGTAIGAYGAGDCGTGIDAHPLPVNGIRLRRVHPNPATGSATTVSLAGVPECDVAVTICDLTGRCVRTVTATLSERGRAECPWDLCDGLGRRVASGVYFVWAEGSGGAGDRAKLVVLR